MSDKKIGLSVAIVTKNEQERLPQCLESVSFADEVVVVDSRSTDSTVDIAIDHGCRVSVEEWKGYGPQVMSAVQKCQNEWVLILDADEMIPPETKGRILEVLKRPAADAYSFPRMNFLHGKWIKHSDWWPDRVVRLVRKGSGEMQARTHGRWVTEGSLDDSLDCPIKHFSFSGYSDMIVTMNNYSTALAKELYRSNASTNPLAPFYHAAGMFLKIYLLKLGFLDGFDGMVIALTKAGGAFFKYAKLIEMHRHGGKS